MIGKYLGSQHPIAHMARGRDLLRRVLRPLAAGNVVGRIIKIIDLLWLPRPKPLRQIRILVWVGGGRNLLRKYSWISRLVEGFGREHPRCLVVGMVLTRSEIREPGENDRRLSYANNTAQLVQAAAVATVLERCEDILAHGIVAA